MARFRDRDEIERLIRRLFKLLKLDDVFPYLLFVLALEELKKVLPGFEIRVVDDSKLTWTRAYADCSTNKIIVRKSVYVGAMNGVPRDRMTLAHEIGHLILGHEGSPADSPVQFSQIADRNKRLQEWEATDQFILYAHSSLQPKRFLRNDFGI